MPRKATQRKSQPASRSSVFHRVTEAAFLALILCNDEAAAAVEGISRHGIKNEGYLEKTPILTPTIAKAVSNAWTKQEFTISSTRDDVGDKDKHFGRFHKGNNPIEASQAEEGRELLREEVSPPATKRIRKTPKKYNRGRGKRGERGAASQMELTQCLQKALEETKLREFGKPKKTNDALIIQQQQYQLYDEHGTLVGKNMEPSSGRMHHHSEEIQRKVRKKFYRYFLFEFGIVFHVTHFSFLNSLFESSMYLIDS